MSTLGFTEEHHMFRESVRKFCQEEIAPYHAEWEKAGQVPRELWLKAGENGFLCFEVPEEYDGEDYVIPPEAKRRIGFHA